MTESIFNNRLLLIEELIRSSDEGTLDIAVLNTMTLEELQEFYNNIFSE